jgi:hypothetical protein
MSKKKLSIVDKLKLKLKQDKKQTYQNTLFIKEKVFFEIPVIKEKKEQEE